MKKAEVKKAKVNFKTNVMWFRHKDYLFEELDLNFGSLEHADRITVTMFNMGYI